MTKKASLTLYEIAHSVISRFPEGCTLEIYAIAKDPCTGKELDRYIADPVMMLKKPRHGLSRSSEHHIWLGMIQRCTDSRCEAFRSYGGRGISVCNRWLFSFENFLNDMGRRPSPTHSLDRIDNNAGYSATNCRWATHYDQSRNRRTNRLIAFNGEIKTMSDWAKQFGMQVGTLGQRLKSGWPIERALLEPVTHRPVPRWVTQRSADARAGKPLPEATRLKLLGRPGNIMTPELREKLGAAHRGRKATPEARQALRIAWIKRREKGLGSPSEETRLKMQAAMKGRRLPAEWCAAIRNGWNKRRAMEAKCQQD